MEIIPNLHFNGDCEKALELYENAFDAKRTVFLRYKDANPLDMDQALDDAIQDYVYHAEIIIENQRLMLTDHLEAFSHGINVSLLVTFRSVKKLQKAFKILRTGAQILIPMTDTTYSSAFVSLIDRFGVRWELIKEN